jgi:hypothetical protein
MDLKEKSNNMLEIKHEHSNDIVGFINAREFLHGETL